MYFANKTSSLHGQGVVTDENSYKLCECQCRQQQQIGVLVFCKSQQLPNQCRFCTNGRSCSNCVIFLSETYMQHYMVCISIRNRGLTSQMVSMRLETQQWSYEKIKQPIDWPELIHCRMHGLVLDHVVIHLIFIVYICISSKKTAFSKIMTRMTTQDKSVQLRRLLTCRVESIYSVRIQ